MQDRAYLLGFITKCAENGISPYDAGALFKLAYAEATLNQTPTHVREFWGDPLTQYGLSAYNYNNRNMVSPYADVYNQYYRGLMGKTEDGFDDDSAAREFASRMQDLDAGKPSTALNRWWRRLWYSKDENRRYFEDMANERAQSVINDMQNRRARQKAIQSQVASLAPGYKPPPPKPAAPAAPAAAVTTPAPAAAQPSQSFVRRPHGHRI